MAAGIRPEWLHGLALAMVAGLIGVAAPGMAQDALP